MSVSVGIGLAFVAMLCWGFGDFLIQRSTRKIGDWETLFVICAFGSVILLPFVYKNIPAVLTGSIDNLLILLVCSLVLLFAALLDFEALKKGKLAVVEPIWSFEIPASALLAYFILREHISWEQVILIILLIIGLCLVSFRGKYLKKEFLLEKGVLIAFVAAFIMGAANFFYGWGARVADPLMVNFFVNVFVTIVTGAYLLFRGQVKRTIRDIINNRALLLVMSISDNAAWVAFAFAMVLTPIAVAVALSESYIIVAVLLGLLVNREKLQSHQKIGLIIALAAALILAAITA
ncbi:MAG TPA: DMT family transporter [Candidatus Paceibacterota bacterium]